MDLFSTVFLPHAFLANVMCQLVRTKAAESASLKIKANSLTTRSERQSNLLQDVLQSYLGWTARLHPACPETSSLAVITPHVTLQKLVQLLILSIPSTCVAVSTPMNQCATR